MKKRPAVQLYVNDWLGSTAIALMTPAEEGAYIRLLCHSWTADDCGLPDDDEQLAVLSRLGRAWGKSSERLRKQFVRLDGHPGRLYNKRLLQVRAESDAWHDRQRESGKRGSDKRWGKDGKPIATPLPDDGEPMATPSNMNGKPIARASGSSSSSSSSSSDTENLVSQNLSSIRLAAAVRPPKSGVGLKLPDADVSVIDTTARAREETRPVDFEDVKEAWFQQWWSRFWRKQNILSARREFGKVIKSETELQDACTAMMRDRSAMIRRRHEDRENATSWLRQYDAARAARWKREAEQRRRAEASPAGGIQ